MNFSPVIDKSFDCLVSSALTYLTCGFGKVYMYEISQIFPVCSQREQTYLVTLYNTSVIKPGNHVNFYTAIY